ncbi:endoribonuclease Dicer-like protein [Dinothrombium tinctorium]|uniref:Endoribonuclease Dicer-like protein n=1 Tax=Dinothrombium tinctorium TaxID=1965070 RepID=A0A3S3PNR8_9ACAR|nr:endoribonuclease Dicer-like protein [Dinothrombium tinctorium]
MTVTEKELNKCSNLENNESIVRKDVGKRLQQKRTIFDSMPVESKSFIPRPYQVEIFELAKTRNTIVCLGTGTGKTFIAVMLIDHFSYQIRGNYHEHAKRTIVLVPKVPLVSQQAKVIRNHLDLKVGEYIGDMNVDTWDKNFWESELVENQVLVMTAEIFRVMITQGIMSLSKVNLLILDEAHWAIGNHPYREIMRCFDTCQNPPKILGLSASLINCKAKPADIKKMIKELEKTLRATCETASDLRTVTKYGTKPEEVLWYFKPPLSFLRHQPVASAITQLESCINFLKEINYEYLSKGSSSIVPVRKCLGTVAYVLQTMGYWCVKKVAEMYITEIAETTAMFLSADPIYSGILSAATTILNVLRRTIMSILDNYSQVEQLTKFSTPKMFCLLDILKDYKPPDDPSFSEESPTNEQENLIRPLCGIVFAERRAVVRVLSVWLQKLAEASPENYGFLKVEYVLGHGGNSGGTSSRMSNKRQEDALSRFRKHECNLLIATSVLEEGLDVPRCNLVVRYDLPKSFREYMQSKGRARADKARYIMLTENETDNKVKVRSTLKEFYEVEQILMQSCNDRRSPTPEDNDENDDQLLPPFMPIKEDGAPRVTLNSAIALVNRYCLKLPSDSFTKLAPHCTVEPTSESSYRCSIRLPINSPIREMIHGPEMPNKKLAKKAAALEVCKRLHKEGELDNNLLPVGKEGIKDAIELGLEPYEDENEKGKEKGQPRAGTTKRRQYYFKRVASALKGSPPLPGDKCRLYVFSMKLTCPIPEEQNTRGRKITDPADTPRCFGFITTSCVPSIPSFPVFTRSGEVIVSLKNVDEEFIFSDVDLERIKSFHRFTFHNVLRLVKYPMRYDPEKAQTSFFVVPVVGETFNDLDSKIQVDWKFIEKVEAYEKDGEKEISEEARKNFVFDKEIYEDAVIKPWYRKNKQQFYFYVAEITDLTPRSPFPDADYETFEMYYRGKYKEHIMNLDQPLLDVDHTSARLNLLTPRYVNRKGMTLPTSTQKTKKEKRENLQQKQILVPELCILHPFPASFWRKAVCLPCILYRLNSLLVAEELRQEVARNIGIGFINLPAGKSWPPLDFGWTLADVLAQAAEKGTSLDDEKIKLPETEIWSADDSGTEKSAKEQNENKDKTSQNDSDFVIDTFDPSTCQINEDREFDDFDEFNNLDLVPLGGGAYNVFGGPIGSWDEIQKQTKICKVKELDDDGNIIEDYENEDEGVRIGSPSRFENEDSNWELGWDEDLTQVYEIGVPGLSTIFGPKGFNLQGLSKDLATCQEEDNWDLFDDYDSDEELLLEDDEEAAEFDPYYEKKTVNISSTSRQSKKEEFVKEMLSNGLMNLENIDDDNLDEGINKLYETISSECVVSIQNDFSENEEKFFDFDKHFTVVEPVHDNDESFKDDFKETIKIIKEIEKEAYLVAEKNPEVEVWNAVDKNLEENVNAAKESGSQLPEPSFGELLPNREMVVVAESTFRFDPYKSDFTNSDGPSPSEILQALTMSNASDGINLERLETVGDSFLKYAVTAFLYCFCPSIHEGKLSYLRSRQISNYNLYRLGRRKGLGELMVGTKFEPNDNWLPPGYVLPQGLEQALIDSGNMDVAYDIGALKDIDRENMSEAEVREEVLKHKTQWVSNAASHFEFETFNDVDMAASVKQIPYNLLTQHSIPDKSIADCVEALIGAYLISSGPKGALLFMKWLGLKVMPDDVDEFNRDDNDLVWHWLPKAKSPLLFDDPMAEEKLMRLYKGSGLDRFEKEVLNYEFRDKAYLVQAFTHNSFCDNYVTDCYQRLEFLGDAVLDFLITRHLYEDPQKHSPGVLTDLRSALVNNTFFASLAVKYEFQRYLKLSSYDLFRVISAFVEKCTASDGMTAGEECNLYFGEGECEYSEDVEVPKALGDIFESVAGAIFLDSGMSLDAVWRVYYSMMKPEIERFSKKPPKSHIRELLETEPQNAVFGKPELIPGRKVRVVVEVFGEGKFVGIGRNKRLAKCTAAKRALRALKAKRNILS